MYLCPSFRADLGRARVVEDGVDGLQGSLRERHLCDPGEIGCIRPRLLELVISGVSYALTSSGRVGIVVRRAPLQELALLGLGSSACLLAVLIEYLLRFSNRFGP
jgi:hypothetical protein